MRPSYDRDGVVSSELSFKGVAKSGDAARTSVCATVCSSGKSAIAPTPISRLRIETDVNVLLRDIL
jgi:hypothetical protein